MIPKELCHYTKKDIALEKILFKRQIKLGSCGNTNDPKESGWQSTAVAAPINNDLHIDFLNKIATEADKIRKEEWKVLCLTKHSPKRKPNDRIKGDVVRWFSPGYSRPRMWAQYAENHSGVCLIFDGKQLHENIEKELKSRCKIIYGSVSYKNYGSARSLFIDIPDQLTDGLTEIIRNHYLKNHEHYFLSKYPDWKHESEFRWLVHSPEKSEEFVSIEGALKSVLVGSAFPEVYEPAVITICKELKVAVGKMAWTNGLPQPSLNILYDPKK